MNSRFGACYFLSTRREITTGQGIVNVAVSGQKTVGTKTTMPAPVWRNTVKFLVILFSIIAKTAAGKQSQVCDFDLTAQTFRTPNRDIQFIGGAHVAAGSYDYFIRSIKKTNPVNKADVEYYVESFLSENKEAVSAMEFKRASIAKAEREGRWVAIEASQNELSEREFRKTAKDVEADRRAMLNHNVPKELVWRILTVQYGRFFSSLEGTPKKYRVRFVGANDPKLTDRAFKVHDDLLGSLDNLEALTKSGKIKVEIAQLRKLRRQAYKGIADLTKLEEVVQSASDEPSRTQANLFKKQVQELALLQRGRSFAAADIVNSQPGNGLLIFGGDHFDDIISRLKESCAKQMTPQPTNSDR